VTAPRAQWGSKVGFILAAAGSAVGLGNLWKFPYVAGENGGGAFILAYLVCVIFVGVPLMAGEIIIGRATQKSRRWCRPQPRRSRHPRTPREPDNGTHLNRTLARFRCLAETRPITQQR
jgi:hypothetical protein